MLESMIVSTEATEIAEALPQLVMVSGSSVCNTLLVATYSTLAVFAFFAGISVTTAQRFRSKIRCLVL